jgi:Reverse transcriptase (RNA-dependent DNA polymerase)
LIVFLAELNILSLWGADVSSAYLEAITQENVYFTAGPKFGDKFGHTMVVNKALYVLRSSGLCWHEKFAGILQSMGFFQSRGEQNIWMRKNGDRYEYIGVYVDDLAIAAENSSEIIHTIEKDHGLKLKGTGPLRFHLGCDFDRDTNGTLYFGPHSYIDKMLDNYERMFGEKPKEYSSPLENGDHPDIDDSDLLDPGDIPKYQSLIGASQWAISLGCFDIQTAVMTMSHLSPRKGHLERMQRIYGYLSKY